MRYVFCRETNHTGETHWKTSETVSNPFKDNISDRIFFDAFSLCLNDNRYGSMLHFYCWWTKKNLTLEPPVCIAMLPPPAVTSPPAAGSPLPLPSPLPGAGCPPRGCSSEHRFFSVTELTFLLDLCELAFWTVCWNCHLACVIGTSINKQQPFHKSSRLSVTDCDSRVGIECVR